MAEEKATMELDRYAMIKGRFPIVKFSEPPNPLLLCQLCQAVMNYPHQLVAGKKSVKRGCYVCLQEIVQDGQRLESVSMLEDIISELEVTCRRCKEIVKIGDLYQHDNNNCPELEIKCDVCNVFLKKAELAAHQLTQEHIVPVLNQKLDGALAELVKLQSTCQIQEEMIIELRSMLTEEKHDDVIERLIWSNYSFSDVGRLYVSTYNVTDSGDLVILPKMTNIAYVKTNCITNSVTAYSFILHQSLVPYARTTGLLKARSTTPTYAEFIDHTKLIARFGIDTDGSSQDITPCHTSKYGFSSFKLAKCRDVEIKEISENEILKRELNKTTKVTYLIDSRSRSPANVEIGIYFNDIYTGLKYSVNCENSVLVPYLFAVNGTDTIFPIATIIGYEPADKVQELLADFTDDFMAILWSL
jgi:phage FluMu protein Com